MYKERTKGATTGMFIIGLVILIAISVLCYIFGDQNAASTTFNEKAGFYLYGDYRGLYLRQLVSTAIPVIFYSIAYWQVMGKVHNHGTMSKVGDGKKYVFRWWPLWAVLAGVCAVVVALIVFQASFHSQAAETRSAIIKYNLWLVWLLQGGLTIGTFFLPFCKPLKK